MSTDVEVCCKCCRSKKAWIAFAIFLTYWIIVGICVLYALYVLQPDDYFATGFLTVTPFLTAIESLVFLGQTCEYSSEASKEVEPKPKPKVKVKPKPKVKPPEEVEEPKEPPKEVTSSNPVSSYETVTEIRNPYEDSSVEV